MPTFVEYTSKLQQAVDAVISPLGYRETQQQRRSGRNSLNAQRIPRTTSTGETSSYQRDFKLILAQVTGGWQVRIVDGASYDPATESSDRSLAYVNGDPYEIAAWTSPILTSNAAFWLRFNTPADEQGNIVREPSLEIVFGIEAVQNTIQAAYYRLGRLHVDGDYAQIYQDHTSGAVDMKWYYRFEQ